MPTTLAIEQITHNFLLNYWLSKNDLPLGIAKSQYSVPRVTYLLYMQAESHNAKWIFCIVFIHLYRAFLSMSVSESFPTTALILCRSKHAEALYKQLQLQDLPLQRVKVTQVRFLSGL